MPVPNATPRPPCKVQEIVSRERTKCETARWWKGVQQKHKNTNTNTHDAHTSIQTHIGFSTNTNVLTPSSILSDRSVKEPGGAESNLLGATLS